LAVVFVLSLTARLLVLSEHRVMVVGGDEREYVGLAEQLASTGEFRSSDFIQHLFQGGRPGDPTAYRTPVLPTLLALHYALFGPSYFFPRLTLILLSALTCVFLALVGYGLGRPRAGLMAASLWAFWPPAVIGPYAADRFYPETLGVFFLLAHTATLVWIGRVKRQVTLATLSGVFLGLAVLTRGYLAILVPMTLLALLVSTTPTLKSKVALIVAASCIPACWVIRNAIVLGIPALSTQTDHFYLGNNQWARGSFNGDFYFLGEASPQLQQMGDWYPGFWQMSEVQRSRAWSAAAWRCIVRDPSRFLWLLVRKTLIFLSPLQFWSVGWYTLHWPWLPVGALAGLCVVKGARTRSLLALWQLLLPVAAVFAAVLATYAFDRYRFVIEPYVVLLAATFAVDRGTIGRSHPGAGPVEVG
jgi:4-amino-4-deoxy-L-arabinose transferase-like glycosyltransferase